jgi:serine/threonine protein kinase
VSVKCPKCSSENPDTQSFCGDCGTNLGTPKDIALHTKTIETPYPQFSPGTSLADRYEIIQELGKGGMGEVYLAEDTNLKRQVAIKVLPQQFALDKERLARFEREARLLASLNHPNIATIHGLEKSDGQQFLVMELVEGDTLAEQIKKGPLPVDEALDLCNQIAEGLESAHEKGIIHRDLKPSNVKVTPDGKVKILDFGLAKAFLDQSGDSDLSKSPAIAEEMTEKGVILGTTAYMSPEQAKGKSADKRADIWAFGCILFECLTGKRPFEGNTITETIASILKDDPNWASLPINIPGIISILLQRCLRKDAKKRLQDIGDARIEIEDALSETPLSVQAVSGRVVSRRFVMSRWVTGILILLTAIIVGITTWLLTRSEISILSRRFIIMPSSDAPIASGEGTDVAVSPDGKRIIYVAGTGTSSQLYMRLINEYDSKPIDGTKNGRMPFFSPDGDWLGYYSDSNQKLMKISILSAKFVPLEICNAKAVFSAFWGSDDNIYIGSRSGYGIRRVSAEGGVPASITTIDRENNEITHDSPVLLPDGNTLLYTVMKEEFPEECLIVVQNLKTGDRKTLTKGGTNIQFAQSGHLAYNRKGTLLAAPFHLKQLQVGDWVPVVDDIRAGGSLAAEFSLSGEETLVYVYGMTSVETYPMWINKQGVEIPIAEKKSMYTNAKISPEGNNVAFIILDKQTRNENIWIYDLQSGVNQQITFEGRNRSFVWSPDGKRIAYVSEREGTSSIHLKSLIDDRWTTTLLTSKNLILLNSWSPDGNWLAYESTASGNYDIWLYSFKDNKSDPYLNSVSKEEDPIFSANGKWIAYTSDEEGSDQIYVRSFASGGGKWKISLDGGFNPKWAVLGDRLFYQSENKIMSVSVTMTPAFQILEQPEPLYESIGIRDYDVHPKDNRLLVVKVSGEFEDRRQIRIVLNWIEELNRLSGQGRD